MVSVFSTAQEALDDFGGNAGFSKVAAAGGEVDEEDDNDVSSSIHPIEW